MLWQRGHSFSRGAETLCWARRLSRRVLDCRFLGTAMRAAGSGRAPNVPEPPAQRALRDVRRISRVSNRAIFAIRGSPPCSWRCASGSASLSDSPQTAQSPAQSVRQSGCAGSARTSASFAQRSTSRLPSRDVGTAQLLVARWRLIDLPGIDLQQIGAGLQTADAGSGQLAGEPEAKRVAGSSSARRRVAPRCPRRPASRSARRARWAPARPRCRAREPAPRTAPGARDRRFRLPHTLASRVARQR